MFDAQRLLGNLLSSGRSSQKTSFLSRSLGLPGGKVGTLTLLGGVAVAAFEHFSKQSRQAATPAPPRTPPAVAPEAGASAPPPGTEHRPPPPPPGGTTAPPPPPGTGTTTPTPAQPADANQLALTLVRAMIAAAKADGEIDPEERRRILERLSGISAEERAFVETEMDKPLNLDELLAEVKGEAMAAEVYTASLLAIDLDTTAEVKYLKNLARRLGLSEATVNQIHDRVGAVRIFA